MKKMAKFSIVVNPLVDPNIKHIYHSREPELLIKVVLLDDMTKEQNDHFRTRFPNRVFNKVLGTRYILVLEKIFTPDKKEQLDKVLKRAADWYVAYEKAMGNDAIFEKRADIRKSNYISTIDPEKEAEKAKLTEMQIGEFVSYLAHKNSFEMMDVMNFKNEWSLNMDELETAMEFGNNGGWSLEYLSKVLREFETFES